MDQDESVGLSYSQFVSLSRVWNGYTYDKTSKWMPSYENIQVLLSLGYIEPVGASGYHITIPGIQYCTDYESLYRENQPYTSIFSPV